MFTGIIESVGTVQSIHKEGKNFVFRILSELTPELSIDQSVSHNGVCLTVEDIDIENNIYRVTAIDETLEKTNLGKLKDGQKVNIERSVTLDKRMDGHMVQGHVDEIVECTAVKDVEGSTLFTFLLNPHKRHLLVPQGSVTLDGVSLTVARLNEMEFSVAIIPYTLDNTIIHSWKQGTKVNIEYDIFGKYLERYLEVYGKGWNSK